jgi:hypothetical protein
MVINILAFMNALSAQSNDPYKRNRSCFFILPVLSKHDNWIVVRISLPALTPLNPSYMAIRMHETADNLPRFAVAVQSSLSGRRSAL